MALSFDKAQLGNLEYSLQREMLATNRAGGYMSTTIVCCNTRKYHGLMVCPIKELNDDEFVLLSSLDETIIQHEQSFNLAIHRFKGSYEPKGHKYLIDFKYTPTQTFTYRVGGVILKKELLWVHSAEQLLIRYTLEQATSQTKLRLRPFLAFRNRHSLSKANMEANGKSYPVMGGVRNQPYDSLPSLYMQLSRPASHVAVPDWYYGFEYINEIKRGFPAYEDLLTTGYFELELKAGESVVFSASTSEVSPDQLSQLFDQELAKRTNKKDFRTVLSHSARQFLIMYQGSTMLQAGYPWYNPRSRATFIALAGCTLAQDNPMISHCGDILHHHKCRLKNGIFGTHLAADTQLWFFHTLSEYEKHVGSDAVWRDFGEQMREILWTYRQGKTPDKCIRMESGGLIYASKEGVPLQWMNTRVEGRAVNVRSGYTVEVNALWYNAVCYTLELARKANDTQFVAEWEMLPEMIEESFQKVFWCDKRRYLADYMNFGFHNFDIRPNQLMAVSLKYSPLSEEQQGCVVNIVRDHLLTSKGIRSLSPRNLKYVGRYQGSQPERDNAAHQGTVYPWLLEHYVRAQFKLSGKSFIFTAEELLEGLREEITLYGIGSVPEVYDGDPPHYPGGAISFAPSVGAIMQIQKMIEDMKR